MAASSDPATTRPAHDSSIASRPPPRLYGAGGRLLQTPLPRKPLADAPRPSKLERTAMELGLERRVQTLAINLPERMRTNLDLRADSPPVEVSALRAELKWRAGPSASPDMSAFTQHGRAPGNHEEAEAVVSDTGCGGADPAYAMVTQKQPTFPPLANAKDAGSAKATAAAAAGGRRPVPDRLVSRRGTASTPNLVVAAARRELSAGEPLRRNDKRPPRPTLPRSRPSPDADASTATLQASRRVPPRKCPPLPAPAESSAQLEPTPTPHQDAPGLAGETWRADAFAARRVALSCLEPELQQQVRKRRQVERLAQREAAARAFFEAAGDAEGPAIAPGAVPWSGLLPGVRVSIRSALDARA